ncbi:O-antigen polymerase [Acanthopleuribacter pedis]|uniref:Oligosaccharide repeat unit polymerase n=1 Tax=Acanthopleuribacter pedis TaxID=442870 RepID=A0A8J7U6S7_9BACT|nr:O-antigen polymerase [Acanthopleuribacter pedis]MBO1322244.1 oligosaccharide repeat unit polymerase [Acanthopleuribacter pedis]
MIFVTLMAIAFLGLFLSKWLFDDFFTPPAIYNFFWNLAIAFLSLNLVRYHPVGTEAWTAIGASYTAFMGGSALVAVYALQRPAWLTNQTRLAYINRSRFETALFAMFAVGILGFVMQLFHLHQQFGLATFFTDPQRARELHSNVRFLGFFNLLNVANFVFGLMYLALYRKPRRWIIAILFWSLATAFFTTDRTRLFYMAIWSFYVVVYSQRRVNISFRFALASSSVVLGLLGMFMLIARLYVKEAYDYNRQFLRYPELGPLNDIYIYLTGSFPVLQQFLTDKWDWTYGKHTFAPVVTFMELLVPHFEREVLVGKFYWVPIHLNVCTYLETFYKDWGFLGLIFGPLVCGIVSMWIYMAMRQRRNLFTVFFAGLISFCVTISVFINFYSQIATWFFVAVGYIVYRWSYSTEPEDPAHFRAGVTMPPPSIR